MKATKSIGSSAKNWLKKLPNSKTASDYFLLIPCAFILMYGVIALLRMGYPYELEWLESVVLQHVQRVLAGQPIYVRPSLEFTPLIYNPLYYYAGAVFAKVLGPDFLSLRLLSFLASLGCLAFVYLIVYQETKNLRAGIIAAGLYAATFRASGAWFDIARIDSLFLLLLLAGVYTLQTSVSWKSYVWAGVWFFLAFMTKQTALAIIATSLIYTWFWKRQGFWALSLTMGLAAGLSMLLLHYSSDGWYAYYVFGLASHYPLLLPRITSFWTMDLLGVLPVLTGLAPAYFGVMRFNHKFTAFTWLMLLVTLGVLGTSWLARINSGGYENVLMPIYAMLAILAGLAMPLWKEISPLKIKSRQPIRGDLAVVLLLQFLLLLYNPAAQVPKSSDAKTGKELVEMIRLFPGKVFLFYAGYLAGRAGKEQYANIAPLADTILYGTPGPVRNQLINEVRSAIRQHKFSAIIGNGSGYEPLFNFFRPDLEAAYTQKGRLLYSKNAFYPVTGCWVRPNYIYYQWEKNNPNLPVVTELSK